MQRDDLTASVCLDMQLRLEVCEDAIAEPSEQAINFLTQLFNQHDEEGRDFLDKNQLDHVFAPTPGMPWANDILVEAPDASMSLSNFLALWRCVAISCGTEIR